ncbi:hypothetical protein KY328_02435, partial [Candidatus Woesearchaeota archaeon]|nr:hypothetical protein [Candidatus Woesearchaeota archaeon]
MGFYINIRFVKLNSKGIPVWYTSFGEPAKYRKIDPDASRHSFEDCKARRMSKFEEMKPFLEKQGSKVFEVLSTQSCEPYTTDDCLKREKPEFVRNTIDPKTLLKELSKVRKIFREAKRPPTVKKLFVDGKTGYSVEGYFPQFYKIEMRDFDHMTIVPVVESKDFDLEGLTKDMIGKYKKEIKALEKYTDYEKLKKKVKKYIETEYEFICETFGKDFKQTKDKYVERKIN